MKAQKIFSLGIAALVAVSANAQLASNELSFNSQTNSFINDVSHAATNQANSDISLLVEKLRCLDEVSYTNCLIVHDNGRVIEQYPNPDRNARSLLKLAVFSAETSLLEYLSGMSYSQKDEVLRNSSVAEYSAKMNELFGVMYLTESGVLDKGELNYDFISLALFYLGKEYDSLANVRNVSKIPQLERIQIYLTLLRPARIKADREIKQEGFDWERYGKDLALLENKVIMDLSLRKAAVLALQGKIEEADAYLSTGLSTLEELYTGDELKSRRERVERSYKAILDKK